MAIGFTKAARIAKRIDVLKNEIGKMQRAVERVKKGKKKKIPKQWRRQAAEASDKIAEKQIQLERLEEQYRGISAPKEKGRRFGGWKTKAAAIGGTGTGIGYWMANEEEAPEPPSPQAPAPAPAQGPAPAPAPQNVPSEFNRYPQGGASSSVPITPVSHRPDPYPEHEAAMRQTWNELEEKAAMSDQEMADRQIASEASPESEDYRSRKNRVAAYREHEGSKYDEYTTGNRQQMIYIPPANPKKFGLPANWNDMSVADQKNWIEGMGVDPLKEIEDEEEDARFLGMERNPFTDEYPDWGNPEGPRSPFMGPPPEGPRSPFMGPPPEEPRSPHMVDPHHFLKQKRNEEFMKALQMLKRIG